MAGPVITGWSALSPYGIGRKALLDGLHTGRPAPNRLVPGFDPREALGMKSTKAMNRISGLAVATTGLLLEEIDATQSANTALVLGTTCGSVQTMMDLTRSSLTGRKPFHVDPSAIPYAVMNSAAGQCAIFYGLKGPNATLAAGRPSGLVALGYARRLLLAERAQVVLCGAAEEQSAARSRLHELAGQMESLGEGCVMFAVEAGTDAPIAASIDAVVSRFCDGTGWEAAVRLAVEAALRNAGADRNAVWAVVPSGAPGAMGLAEEEAVRAVLSAARVLPSVTGLVGETHSASAAFQLASVLAEPEGAGRLAVLTSVDPSGTVAAAVVGLGEDPSF